VNVRVIRAAALVLLPSLLAFGQDFEVASIKPSDPSAGKTTAGLHIDGAMVRYSSLSLEYNLKNYQISAPDWMVSGRWDITTKLPDGADPKQIPAMLQALLRDRFQMKMHRETKEFPVYGLVVGKGELKLKESPPDTAVEGAEPPRSANIAAAGSSAGAVVTYGNGAYFTLADNKFVGKKLPLATIADALARFADRPVVDMTNLKGNYDFTMQFSPDDFRVMMIRAAIASGVALPPEALRLADASSGDTLFSAVEALGLKLERRKAPLEMLVVDQALKTPTEN
jgi:uncharacterized protein (TIGR03435 family)